MATTISPLPSSKGYAKLVSTPNSTGWGKTWEKGDRAARRSKQLKVVEGAGNTGSRSMSSGVNRYNDASNNIACAMGSLQ